MAPLDSLDKQRDSHNHTNPNPPTKRKYNTLDYANDTDIISRRTRQNIRTTTPSYHTKKALSIRELHTMEPGTLWRITPSPVPHIEYDIWFRPNTTSEWSRRLYVKQSDITCIDENGDMKPIGLGLFSAQHFSAGEPITYYDGRIASHSLLKRLIKTPGGKSFVHYKQGLAINGSYCPTGAQFANDNSSVSNNMRTLNPAHDKTRRGFQTLEAKHDITPNTELTWHYGSLYWSKTFTIDTQSIPREIIFPNRHSPYTPPTPTISPHACLAYSRTNNILFIDELFTSKNHRGKNIAHNLLKTLLNENPNAKQVHLVVRLNALQQKEARDMYSKLGFKPTETRISIDDGDAGLVTVTCKPNQVYLKVSTKTLLTNLNKRTNTLSFYSHERTSLQLDNFHFGDLLTDLTIHHEGYAHAWGADPGSRLPTTRCLSYAH